MKKTTVIFIVFILAFLVVGCTGSGNESQNVSTGDVAQESNTSDIITPTPNVTHTPTQLVYQDIGWAQYTQQYSLLIGTDLTNVGSAAQNLDFTTQGIAGQNVIDDTQRALDENDQYHISPKYQDAKNEWVLALMDYNSAGKYIILAADDGKTGKTNSENVNKAMSLCSSGMGHVNRAKALIQAEAGTV